MATSMWQQTEEMAKKHDQGTGLWLRLQNDEDKAVVVFLGEPHPREVAFVDGKYVEVDEKMKADGVRASLRIALNVALFDTQEVKVLEQGVVFFKDLVRVREKYGLNKWAFEIQRHGAAEESEDHVLDPPGAPAHPRAAAHLPGARAARPGEALRRRVRRSLRQVVPRQLRPEG